MKHNPYLAGVRRDLHCTLSTHCPDLSLRLRQEGFYSAEFSSDEALTLQVTLQSKHFRQSKLPTTNGVPSPLRFKSPTYRGTCGHAFALTFLCPSSTVGWRPFSLFAASVWDCSTPLPSGGDSYRSFLLLCPQYTSAACFTSIRRFIHSLHQPHAVGTDFGNLQTRSLREQRGETRSS